MDLTEEVRALKAQNAALSAALQEEKNRLNEQAIRIRQLEEMLATLRRQRFGSTSEKDVPDQQLELFNEAEAVVADDAVVDQSTDVKAHTRKRSGRPALPESLPREDVVYDLDESEKVCPHDGTPLKEIAPVRSEQLDIVPAQIKVLVHTQKQYACPCCERHVATASKPKQPLGKSMASPGLLAWVAVSKYCDALPLYRQSQMFERIGVSLDRSSMAHWMVRVGELVQPLVNRLSEHILSADVVEMDETTTQVLAEPGKTAQSTSYMWVMGSGPPGQRNVVFQYHPSRKASVATAMLEGYRGALMVDGYDGYRPTDGVVRLGCMAHVRRKFFDAKKVQPKGKTGKPDQALSWIRQLYAIEQQGKTLSREERHQLRQRQAVPILSKMHAWLEKSLRQVPPKTKLGEAVAYAWKQWSRVSRYVDDGAYPIDNNRIENAIRPFAIGRKNWLFAQSQAGARASANLYSLIESAKGHGLEPYHYLRQVLSKLPSAETVDDADALLPGAVEV